MQQEMTGRWYSTEYWSFTIHDEASKYLIHADGYSGDAGDGLYSTSVYLYPDGLKFTTYDHDNDGWSGGNCAPHYKGGYWYTLCYKWCLTCQPSTNDLLESEHKIISVSRMMMKQQD